MADRKCVAGCRVFDGGERKHHLDCPHYPESLTKLWHDTKLEMRAEIDRLRAWLWSIGYAADVETKDDLMTAAREALTESRWEGDVEQLLPLDVAGNNSGNERIGRMSETETAAPSKGWMITSFKKVKRKGEIKIVVKEFGEAGEPTGAKLEVSGNSLSRLREIVQPTGAVNLSILSDGR